MNKPKGKLECQSEDRWKVWSERHMQYATCSKGCVTNSTLSFPIAEGKETADPSAPKLGEKEEPPARESCSECWVPLVPSQDSFCLGWGGGLRAAPQTILKQRGSGVTVSRKGKTRREKKQTGSFPGPGKGR